MTQSDIPVLNQLLEDQQAKLAAGMTETEFFEIFAAENILRNEHVDQTDIESGLTGGTQANREKSDGGVDGFYIFADGKLISDVAEADKYAQAVKRNIVVNTVILQASVEDGFALNRLTRLSDTIEDIFDIQRQPKDFTERYNDALLEAIQTFRALHRVLLNKHPRISVSFFYVTKGQTSVINSDTSGTARDIEAKVKSILPTIDESHFTFIGARELIALARAPVPFTHTLSCSDSMQLQQSSACVALVPLKDFKDFITDDKGGLRTSLFESNVRDYQGDKTVNVEIGETLKTPETGIEFWWLNNGITIVASSVKATRSQVVLDDPQIVNGLQTSQKLFDHLSSHDVPSSEVRHVLVRMIPAPDTKAHDAIIRATNRQIAIPQAHLWATTQIHRDIETLFNGEGLYYDRRKNSWKREGKPFDTVVSMTELAQAVAAIIRQEPDHARARPARYFTKENHRRIFADGFIHAYAPCARLKKKTAAFLRSVESNRLHRTNLLFYVLLTAVCVACKTAKPTYKHLSQSKTEANVNDQLLRSALDFVRPIYVKYGGDDKAAKGNEFAAELKTALLEKYPFKKRKKARK